MLEVPGDVSRSVQFTFTFNGGRTFTKNIPYVAPDMEDLTNARGAVASLIMRTVFLPWPGRCFTALVCICT